MKELSTLSLSWNTRFLLNEFEFRVDVFVSKQETNRKQLVSTTHRTHLYEKALLTASQRWVETRFKKQIVGYRNIDLLLLFARFKRNEFLAY